MYSLHMWSLHMWSLHMWSLYPVEHVEPPIFHLVHFGNLGFHFGSFWKPWFPFKFILETFVSISVHFETLVSILDHFGNLGFHKGVKPPS